MAGEQVHGKLRAMSALESVNLSNQLSMISFFFFKHYLDICGWFGKDGRCFTWDLPSHFPLHGFLFVCFLVFGFFLIPKPQILQKGGKSHGLVNQRSHMI